MANEKKPVAPVIRAWIRENVKVGSQFEFEQIVPGVSMYGLSRDDCRWILRRMTVNDEIDQVTRGVWVNSGKLPKTDELNGNRAGRVKTEDRDIGQPECALRLAQAMGLIV